MQYSTEVKLINNMDRNIVTAKPTVAVKSAAIEIAEVYMSDD